eukprot:scaffold3405_cov167-Amphora_coffeaeformis.AAC.6
MIDAATRQTSLQSDPTQTSSVMCGTGVPIMHRAEQIAGSYVHSSDTWSSVGRYPIVDKGVRKPEVAA